MTLTLKKKPRRLHSLHRAAPFIVLAASILTFIAGSNAKAAAADAPPSAVMIIDSSNSMAAIGPDGRTKLDAARTTMTAVLADWPSETRLAVMAYGHRHQSDCTDIETLVDMGPPSPARIAGKLAALRARGKTPISESLRRAAAMLPDSGGTIVLVSDGIETCNADPCAVAQELKRAQAKLIIHIVGFGVTRKEAEQLRCIVDKGGGKYFNAADAPALATALTDVASTIKATDSVSSPPSSSSTPPPLPSPEQISLVAVAGTLGRIVDAPVQWRVSTVSGDVVYAGTSRALSLTLPVGRYHAEGIAANARGEISFTVATGETAQKEFEVPIAAGRLDLTLAPHAKAPPFTDGEAQGVVWTLDPKDGQGPAEIPPIAHPSLLLAPGHYTVHARIKDMEAEGSTTVESGKPTALTLNFKLGSLILEAALNKNSAPLADAGLINWHIGTANTTRLINGEARPHLILREGSYPVVLAIAGAKVTAQAVIVAGEERVTRVIVKGGELQLSARLGPQSPPLTDWKDVSWTVEAVTAVGVKPGTKAIERLAAATTQIELAAGRWRLTTNSGKVNLSREVTITPGAASSLLVDLDAARLTMLASPEEGKKLPMNVVFSVSALDANGTPTPRPIFEAGDRKEASVIVPTGAWRVIAEDEQGRQAATEVTLAPGEERVLRLMLK